MVIRELLAYLASQVLKARLVSVFVVTLALLGRSGPMVIKARREREANVALVGRLVQRGLKGLLAFKASLAFCRLTA